MGMGTSQTLETYSMLKSDTTSAEDKTFVDYMGLETGLPIEEPDLSCSLLASRNQTVQAR